MKELQWESYMDSSVLVLMMTYSGDGDGDGDGIKVALLDLYKI